MHCGYPRILGSGAWNRGKSHAMQVPIQSNRLREPQQFPAGDAAESMPGSSGLPELDLIPDLIYDLRLIPAAPDGFYSDVTAFSDKLLAESELLAGAVIRGYGHFVQTSLGEPPRSQGEYAIELLTLGLALRRYESAARTTPRWAVALAKNLFRMRRSWVRMKPVADLLRARIIRYFLMPNIGRESAGCYSLDQLPRLIEWLRATGEFEQETARLAYWWRFLATLPPDSAAYWIETAAELFDWFQREANAALGSYTRGVPRFLAAEYRTRGCREDQVFCGKEPAEYHLSMVAAEVINRGLRADFERKAHKAVLVPACMRGPYATFCKARTSGTDIQCAACSPGCTVNRITRRMRGMGAKVFLVPHATGFSRWLERWQQEPDTGVAAVACLLNILPGGYEMRARGIASQCLPLDYPGCQKHWRRDEIATSLNEDQLVRLLQPAQIAASPPN